MIQSIAGEQWTVRALPREHALCRADRAADGPRVEGGVPTGYRRVPPTDLVGGKAANGFGLHDMSGNVTEWVGDSFGQYSSTPQVNPFNAFGSSKNVRGGSWQNTTNNSRLSYRNFYQPTVSSSLIGFRVARNP